MNDRFFSMSQLWQSLLLTIVIGGALLAGITYGVMGFAKPSTQATELPSATSSPAAAALPAAVGSLASEPAVPSDPWSALRLSGQAAIVVDLSTSKTMYAQNADTPLPLASLTKLLTLYAAGQVLSLSSVVTISSSSFAQDGDYGFSIGESFTFQDLARLALVASANDAAQAIAEAAEAASGKDDAQFMQGAVSATGLSHTSAANGTGLDLDTTNASAFGTARDIAKLAQEFLASQPTLAKATTRSAASVYSTAGTLHSLANTNPDASRLTGLLLSKTGYTDLAGGNLAVVFDAGIGHPVAVVVLGSTKDARFTDVEKLMRAARQDLANDAEAP